MSPTYVVASDQERRTPSWLYRACCDLLGVAACRLDAFAWGENALCERYYSELDDGLARPWVDRTFCNPPFKLMARVVDKAIAELQVNGVRSALVGPAGCSQVWFHRLWPHATVYLPDRRLVFLDRDGRPTRGAMQDSAVYIVNNPSPRERPEVLVLRVDDWSEAP